MEDAAIILGRLMKARDEIKRLNAILETYRAPLREARLSGQVSEKQWLQHLADDPGLEVSE